MNKRVTLIGQDLTRDIQQSDLPVALFILTTPQSNFNLSYSGRGRGQLGDGATKVKKGTKADKGTENKIWTEGKQKGDESPKLTQRQNGLLINSGDNGTGIFGRMAEITIYNL